MVNLELMWRIKVARLQARLKNIDGIMMLKINDVGGVIYDSIEYTAKSGWVSCG